MSVGINLYLIQSLRKHACEAMSTLPMFTAVSVDMSSSSHYERMIADQQESLSCWRTLKPLSGAPTDLLACRVFSCQIASDIEVCFPVAMPFLLPASDGPLADTVTQWFLVKSQCS